MSLDISRVYTCGVIKNVICNFVWDNYRYGPVVINSVTTVTGDGSRLRLKADAFLSRSSSVSPVKTAAAGAVLIVELDSNGSGDTFSYGGLCALLAERSLGVEYSPGERSDIVPDVEVRFIEDFGRGNVLLHSSE